MKKDMKKLIAGVVAVAVLLGAYVFLQQHPKKEDTSDKTDGTVTLTDHKVKDISSVTVQLTDAEPFTVNIKSAEAGFSCTLTGGTEGVEYDQTKLQALVNSAISLTGKEVESKRDNLKEYGLEAGAAQVSITYADGKRDVVTLGVRNAALGSYMLYNDDPKVYLLDAELADQMKTELSGYRSLVVVSGITDLTSELNRLAIDRFGAKGKQKTFEIIRRPAGELTGEKAEAYSTFVMKKPRQADAGDDNLVERIYAPLLSGLTATGIAEDFPKDLSIYGLDKPVKIQMETDSVKATLLVGSEKDGSRYVMLQGANTVFTCQSASFDFLTGDYRDYCSAVLWTHNIKDIGKITVQAGAKVYETVLKHGDGDKLTATRDGKAVDEQEARKLFAQTISVRMEDELDTPAKAQGDVQYKLTLTYTNGTEHNIRFIKGGSRQFIASVDGGGYVYVVNSTELDNIMAYFK